MEEEQVSTRERARERQDGRGRRHARTHLISEDVDANESNWCGKDDRHHCGDENLLTPCVPLLELRVVRGIVLEYEV